MFLNAFWFFFYYLVADKLEVENQLIIVFYTNIIIASNVSTQI